MNLLGEVNQIPESERCIVVVSITTSHWSDKRGLNMRRQVRYLNHKCKNHNFLEEDCSMVGADESWARITNLDECKDGVYQVVTCNESKDLETGIIDDYDFMLVPYKEK